jgi:hypothetical protein
LPSRHPAREEVPGRRDDHVRRGLQQAGICRPGVIIAALGTPGLAPIEVIRMQPGQ